ncbi:hypothetical protein [Streptomyces rimosus]|uniref:hypothetical protein n=1 Tax=Streptomyces rimosus TaxID=1927 RepID=UPI0013317C59|nr:hypothetical protein [Streptomyces rimosus]
MQDLDAAYAASRGGAAGTPQNDSSVHATSVLTSALQRTSWSYTGDRFAAGISVLGSLALFVYSLIRDPAQAGTIGEWAHLLAETVGPA